MHTSPETMPMPRMCVFLDIDGVLHSTENEIVGFDRDTEELRVMLVRGRIAPQTLGLLCPVRQQLLADVLARHPHVDLVISSAWRAWEGFNDQNPEDIADPLFEERHVASLDWIKRLLHPVISSRVVGRTGFGETRLDEIRSCVQRLDPEVYARHWIALDDQPRHFPPNMVLIFYDGSAGAAPAWAEECTSEMAVIVDGRQGLCPTSARQLDAALTRATAASRQGPA